MYISANAAEYIAGIGALMLTSPTYLPLPGLLLLTPRTLQGMGLRAVLTTACPHLPLLETADAAALPALLGQQRFRLLVFDATLPGLPAARLLEQVWARWPAQPVLVLAGARLPRPLGQLVARGAGALLSRRAEPAQVVAAIDRLLLAAAPLPLPAEAAPRPPAPLPGPSARELDVLRLVAQDLGNHAIAQRLYLSVRTVESHRRTLLQKAGARSVVGLVLTAVRRGWLSLNE